MSTKAEFYRALEKLARSGNLSTIVHILAKAEGIQAKAQAEHIIMAGWNAGHGTEEADDNEQR